jgi:alpha-1,3-rhamnosyl/mannosyltransferase
VGEVSARKNLPGMARGLAASGVDLPWVWIGSDSFGAGEVDGELERIRDVRILRPGYAPFTDLPAIYSGATALLFATFSEGFGLPALEAMACGTPSVVSDRGSLPEVTGGCALEADPGDAEAVGAATRRLVTDDALRAELSRRGRERAAEFGWDRVAREMVGLYAEAAAERS